LEAWWKRILVRDARESAVDAALEYMDLPALGCAVICQRLLA